MKNRTFEVTYSYDATESGTYRLTLRGLEDERVELDLDKTQYALIESRRTREFYVRCKQEVIMSKIDDARNYAELESLAEKYYLCDTCDFEDINLYGVKRTLKAIVETLYKYPKLRRKICFVGTHHKLAELFVRLENGDKEVLNDFNLQYVCTTENAVKLGKLMRDGLNAIIKDHEGYVATAMSAFGLFDAILLDKNDYDGYAYLEFVSEVRQNEAMGFHPKGCDTPESIVYHELGHLLDGMCCLAENDSFTSYYESLSQDEIRSGLSEYALSSPKEFIAEAFAEYTCSLTPRPIAAKVGRLLESVYGKSR